jgi:threonine aldolase
MIDLSSDTATKPTTGMRQVMATAEVGDEQRGEDPTVNRLLQMVCSLLNKETALFLPSGTMCNCVAIKAHTHPGEAILVDRQAHILRSESGAAAFLSGVILEQLPSNRGRFTSDDVIAAIPRESVYVAHPHLLCVEQAHNHGGGSIWPLEQLSAVCETAHQYGLAVHMDGARLFNAVVATSILAHEYTKFCDSVWIDFTKGLGAPLGAVLAGSEAFIEKARRYKHIFGGALRQAGIVAAGCIYALENHIERLHEDHLNAQILGDGLGSIAGIQVEIPIETNMVFFNVSDTGLEPKDFLAAIEIHGVRMSVMGKRIRAVTHLNISSNDVEKAINVVWQVVKEA